MRLLGGSYVPASGDTLTIIQNNSGTAVTGAFANLPEGAAVSLIANNNTYNFRISYQGGTDHQDVVLTYVPASALTTTTITASPTSAITYGQSASFTAKVSLVQGSAFRLGTVGFFQGNPTNGGFELGTPVQLNVQGTACAIYSTLTASGPPIYAVYFPDQTSTTLRRQHLDAGHGHCESGHAHGHQRDGVEQAI